MAAISWNNAVSGDWSTQADWNPASIPGAADAVTIGVNAAAYTVTVTSAEAADTLTISASKATLEVETALSVGGLLTLGAGTLQLDSAGVINGGTVAAAGGTLSANGGTLAGVEYEGTLDLSALGANLTIEDGITLTGTNGIGPGTVSLTGGYVNLSIENTTTLDNATINIGSSTGYSHLFAYDTVGTGAVLTLGRATTLMQAGAFVELLDTNSIGDGIVNQGSINAGVSSGQFDVSGNSFTNQGSITVSDGDTFDVYSSAAANSGLMTVTGGGTLTINGTSFANSGTLTETGGSTVSLTTGWTNTGSISETASTLNLGGTFTAAQLSKIGISGGTIGITGLSINTGATLNVGTGSTLGTVVLSGTIEGGTVYDAGSGFVFDGGTFDLVTYEGTLDLSALGANLTIDDGITLTGTNGTGPGTVNLTGAYDSLSIENTTTLDNATINIGSSTGYSHLFAYDTVGTGAVLTLGRATTLMQAGAFAALLDTNSIGDGIVNQGSINAGVSSGQFYVSGNSFTNQGSITVSGGDTFDIQSTEFANLSTSELTGGTYVVDAGSTLQLPAVNYIATLAATIVLSGTGSVIESLNPSDVEIPIENTLATIATGGVLRVLGGRNFTAENAITDSGVLEVGADTFKAPSLSVASGASLSVDAGGTLSLTSPLVVNGTVTNAGSINGGGATAVAFGSGIDRLILDRGATFGGTAMGGGVNTTLELAQGTGAGTLNALGESFTNFGTVIVDAGATWTVDAAPSALAGTTLIGNDGLSTLLLTSAGGANLGGVSKFATIDLAAGNSTVTVTDTTLSGGAVTINDGASGNNSVSAAGDTSASKGKTLSYNAGTGTDSFAGGFENDTVSVSTAAVGGDTLTGGSGTNTLFLSNAGTFSLGGVSKFATVRLASSGNDAVTVTDTTLSGGSVTIDAGSTGNETLTAADSAASKGKSLTYNTGSGTDGFTGGFENDTVTVSAAALSGDVLAGGSGTNTLFLTSAGSVGLGEVSKFATIHLAAGNNTVTVTDTTLSVGSVTLYDGTSGNNTVSATGDTSASKGKTLVYNAGTGTDSFTGGFENDTVKVAAAAVSGDTLTAGSGTNSLFVTTAGTFSLGGVSKFATILLAAGNNAVTVTDTTLSGGTVVIKPGASGNNSISAAGDTSASKGKTLYYYTGAGTDSFTGGFENDAVYASAAAVNVGTLTGGSGTNTVFLTNAGTFSLGGVSKFATVRLASTGNDAVTVTDTTLSGGSVTIDAGSTGNETISATGDSAASKGKSLTYNAGTGTDSFTGGFENDAVLVSAAAVGGDTLTGGSGTNTLFLTNAGTFSLGGVSEFATIILAAGNTGVTLTDTTLGIGSVALSGASGNETVNAAGDSAASAGKTLIYVAGAGTDKFTGGFENDTVKVAAASVGGDTLTGGSGTNTLFVTSAGSFGLGGVSKFPTILLAAGNNAVTVTDTTLSVGSVTIKPGASGNNTISAAGDTAASTGKTLTYDTGVATDHFAGGFENDQVHGSAAEVSGDTLTGGSGTNTLFLTGAGSVGLGGVSKFATIDLAAGNSTVTITDTTLSGGTVTLHDGASGNNTISAAGDTAASAGKSLVYMAGAGTDSFTGGFENDTIYAGTGLGTYTAGSGSDSFVFIADNLPAQTLGNFQPSLDDILVYGIHASNGFDLGSADNALNPTTPTAITASIFTASATGAFTSSSQRFAYDTTNGALHYSATGSNSSESLVATLTGAPAVTAADLLFEH